MSTVNTQLTAEGEVIPLWAKRDWETAYLRVKGKAAALRLWYQVLSEDERQRLGGDLDSAYSRFHGGVGMWMNLRGVTLSRAVVDVGIRTGFLDANSGRVLLQVIGEEPDDPQEAFEMAVASGALVLVASPRQAFWESVEIEIDWERLGRPWELLDELARAAKAGAAVDAFTLRERGVRDQDFMKKWKCRMVNAAGFPLSLADRVVAAGRGTYRLDLPPVRIRLFERGACNAFRERTP